MINQELKKYIETTILPKYQTLDLAHSGNHVYDVIEISLEIAKDYDLNLDMVYTIAAFHDVGLVVEREKHHIIGGEMLFHDAFINKYFNNEQIIIMKEAVEDHRASSKHPPRSIYGKVIAEADRSDTMDTIIERTILFRYKENESFETMYPDIYNHIVEKYGEHGYLQVWLETKRTKKMLEDIRKLLLDPKEFKSYVKRKYDLIYKNK